MPRKASTIKLTDGQSALVAENHNLIYAFLRKRNLLCDDFYGVAATGLCKAAGTYDPDRGLAFSTYAYACMANEVRQDMRDHRERLVTVSLEEPIHDELPLSGILESTSPSPDEVVRLRSAIEWLRNRHPKEYLAATLICAGYTESEAGSVIGHAQSYTSKLLKNVAKKMEAMV
jgi:RNA polymerase sigma factor, sigma-70 family